MHKLINLQINVNNEHFSNNNLLQSQSLKLEGVAAIPENILLDFSLILLEVRDNACHKKVTLGS